MDIKSSFDDRDFVVDLTLNDQEVAFVRDRAARLTSLNPGNRSFNFFVLLQQNMNMRNFTDHSRHISLRFSAKDLLTIQLCTIQAVEDWVRTHAETVLVTLQRTS
jgi:hypothetical protein